jgi:peptide/nickel transport system substrate-binding protein
MSEASVTREAFLRRGAGFAALVTLGPGALEAIMAEPAAAARLGVSACLAGGTLTAAIAGDPKTMDPHRTTLAVFHNTIRVAVFDALVKIDDKFQFVPSLAESWKITPKTVTFQLRKGVTFHDGTPFDANAVVFNIKRIKAKKTASNYAPNVATVRSVEAKGKYTVVFHLIAPTPAILANLLEVQLISPASLKSVDKKPVGTGPFVFVEWKPGDHITLAKNPNFFRKGQPRLDTIVFKTVPDAQSRLTSLQTGAVQLVDGLEAKDVKTVKGYSSARVIQSPPILNYEMIQINTKRAPFSDKRVRQALARAFDRETYVKTFWAGIARPGVNPFVQEMKEYLPGSDKRYGFDLDKTAALLAQAGYSKSKPLDMEILNPAGYPNLKAISLLYQDNLGKLGHKVKVTDLELSAWIDRIANKPDFDVTTDVYEMRGPDPTGMFNSDNLAPKGNINQFNPPGYEKLVLAAATESNPAKRIARYRTLQNYLLDNMPMVPICHTPILIGASKKLQGFSPGPTGLYQYGPATLA